MPLREQLVDWLVEYLDHSEKSGFVLGLSGGVDSSVLALLAQEAANRAGKRLLALILPIDNDYYDEQTAREICVRFDVDHQVIDLRNVSETWKATLPQAERPVVFTNLKARLREGTLYYYANNEDLLVLGTVNKGEMAIGYFPKNASASDLIPFADVLKSEIRNLGRDYGLPERVVTAKASGCTWADTAEEEWGFSEEELDIMVTARDAGEKAVLTLPAIHTAKKEQFLRLRAQSAHKRAYYPFLKRSRDA